MASDVPAARWFHGGFPGLKRGGKILPPSVTGVVSVSAIAEMEGNQDIRDKVRAVHRDDRVYLARDMRAALLWASLHPAYGGARKGGDLYEVTPDGPLEADPDYLPGDGGSACCESATIVKVIARRVPRPTPEALAILGAR
jgi:hypothetical protein